MYDTQSKLAQLIDDLERDIRENPDRREAELAALRAAFFAIVSGETPGATPREGSKKLQFRELVDGLLRDSFDDKIHRQEIIKQVQKVDLFPGSKDVDRDVSKYLSTDGTFAPDGDGYWKKKGPPKLV